MTPHFVRSELRALVLDEKRQVKQMPSNFDLTLLPDGSHVVFCFTEAENISIYARTFLEADRARAMARWQLRLHQPSRLPWIGEPIFLKLPLYISSVLRTHPEATRLVCVSANSKDFLVVTAVNQLQIIDLDLWGKEEAFQATPFNHTIQDLSSFTSTPEKGQYCLVDRGTLYRVTYQGPSWRLEPENLPPGVTNQSSLQAVHGFPPNHRLYRFKDGQLWLSTSAEARAINFISPQDSPLQIDDLEWLPDGSIVFTADSKATLWHARLSQLQASPIIGPVSRPPIFFCLDKKGILYVVDSSAKRLQFWLPPEHWLCPACGTHLPSRPQLCPYCQARTRESSGPVSIFRFWLDLDLSSVGNVLGPIAIDDDLNLYLLVDFCRLVSISFSRRDFWGEQEN